MAQDQGREWASAIVPGTRVMRFRSAILDRDLEIGVAIAAVNGTAGPLPTLYVLDGNLLFGAVAQFAAAGQFGPLPPLCVVGVSYPLAPVQTDLDARAEFFRLRNTDLFPYDVADVPPDRKSSAAIFTSSGVGAPMFLRSLKEEVMPLVEASFPADPHDRGIIGYSAGAIFAFYALLSEPGLFRHVIAASPGSWPEMFDDLAASWNTDHPTRVFTSMGGLETDRTDLWQYILDRHNGIGSDNLHVSGHSFPGETHSSVWPSAFTRGLQEVFPQVD